MLTEDITDAVNGNYSASYVYDLVGNRTQSLIDGVTTAYTYDDNDRLTQYGGTTYTYDAIGNTLTDTLGGVVKTYSYNSQNEMTAIDDGVATTVYGYNIDGIRVSQSNAVDDTVYVVDSNRDYAQVLEEVVNGAAAASYVYGDDLVSQQQAGDFRFYHYDGLGSTRSLSDDTGNLTDTYSYEAFGEVLNQTGTTENDYLFTGEQFDAGLDQYYLRARYYDQGVGRFTQMDTWMGNALIPNSLHKYLYTEGDPVNNIDPTGHFLVAVGAGNKIRAILATVAVQTPKLGFTFVKGSAGNIVGVAATTCALSNASSRFGLTATVSQFAEICGDDSHRGRWQAQGDGVQRDQPWTLPAPLTLTYGLQLLDSLEASLSPKQRRDRAIGFQQARIYATRAASAGGVSVTTGVFKRTFPLGATKRVDLDIFKGTAFTAN